MYVLYYSQKLQKRYLEKVSLFPPLLILKNTDDKDDVSLIIMKNNIMNNITKKVKTFPKISTPTD